VDLIALLCDILIALEYDEVDDELIERIRAALEEYQAGQPVLDMEIPW